MELTRSANARVVYDPGLYERMKKMESEGADSVDMWLVRMHSTFERYQQSLPSENIIRYEDICASGGKALEVIVPSAADLEEPLENKNANPLYEREKVLRVGERLLESEGAYWNFYTRENVQEIMDKLS